MLPLKNLKEAYKTANPNRTQYAAKTYDPFYQLSGEKSDLGEERRRILGYLKIDRQISLKAVWNAIVKAFTGAEISSPDPSSIFLITLISSTIRFRS